MANDERHEKNASKLSSEWVVVLVVLLVSVSLLLLLLLVVEEGYERRGTTATVLRHGVRRVGLHAMDDEVHCVAMMDYSRSLLH